MTKMYLYIAKAVKMQTSITSIFVIADLGTDSDRCWYIGIHVFLHLHHRTYNHRKTKAEVISMAS